MENINEKYFHILAKEYPTIQSIAHEIIQLQAILNLPKGTEHYISDLHGEYSAFSHLMNNCSGVIKEKAIFLFQDELNDQQINDLCFLIYYPNEVLKFNYDNDWYKNMILRLIRLCRYVTSKYTRRKVREYIQNDYSDIIDELIHAQLDELDQQYIYHFQIIETIIFLKEHNTFIHILIDIIKHFAIDQLHILGDIYDRGAHPDYIMEDLIEYQRADIQWGNHDILWMGAYLGQYACMITVIKNCIHYHHIDLLERSYGIPLREFMVLACLENPYNNEEEAMEKYCLKLLRILESQLIIEYPEWNMEYRIINKDLKPLTLKEEKLLKDLKRSFTQSIQLRKHMEFLFKNGSLYLRTNHNLLFHGCVPLDENGNFYQYHYFNNIKGKEYFDYVNHLINNAFYYKEKKDIDYFWYLWCGEYSPLCGRRIFLDINSEETKNAYYHFIDDEKICLKILHEFQLFEEECMIINGHTPVRVKEGESPLKGNKRLVVIDGGFCFQNQKKTGVAGYTLISNSHGMRLKTHHIHQGSYKDDVQYDSQIIYTRKHQEMIRDTQKGKYIQEKINDLQKLLIIQRKS